MACARRVSSDDDGLVVCGSEVGAVAVDESRIVPRARSAGPMVAVDLRRVA